MISTLPQLAPIVIVIAALFTAAIIVAIRPLLVRYALARPNERSSHRTPTPQGAGIAVVAAALGVAGTSALAADLPVPFILFATTIFIGLVGMADDMGSIPVLPRLLFQVAAVAAIIFTSAADLRIVPSLPLWIERAGLLLAGLWFVNLVNFMDGIDLMSVAEVLPITAVIVVLGCTGGYPPVPALMAAALCGAMLGFAPFNRPVAKIFLGDVGSLPIGLLLGWCLLQLAWDQQLVAALLLPLYYLADTTITLFWRISKRQPFWVAHRTHFYQRATERGVSVSRIAGEVFALNFVLGALALISTTLVSTIARLLLLTIGAAAVALLLYRLSRAGGGQTKPAR